MDRPPAAPGPSGGHDATQSFPAGGAPPPPPTAPAGAKAAPGYGPGTGAAAGYGYGPSPAGGAGGGDVTGVAAAAGGSGYGYGGPGPAAPPVAGRPRRGRILGRALLVLVVIGALAGTTAWGFVNRSSAERWKERSEAADADLREALDRVEVTQADLEDARTRLRELANEKAGETDRNRILSEIVAQAPEVTAALAECQQETTILANDILSTRGDPAADVAGLQDRVDDVNQICAAALDQAQELEASIEALGI